MSTRPIVLMGDSWAAAMAPQLAVEHSGALTTVAHAGTIDHWVDFWSSGHGDPNAHAAVGTIVAPGDLVVLSVGGIDVLTGLPLGVMKESLGALYDLLMAVPGVDVIHCMYSAGIGSPPHRAIEEPLLPPRPWEGVRIRSTFGEGFRVERHAPTCYAKRIEWFGFGDLEPLTLPDGLHLPTVEYERRVTWFYARSRFLGAD